MRRRKQDNCWLVLLDVHQVPRALRRAQQKRRPSAQALVPCLIIYRLYAEVGEMPNAGLQNRAGGPSRTQRSAAVTLSRKKSTLG